MFISKTKTNSGTTYYLIESYIDYDTKKKSTKIVEKIGSFEELQKKLGKDVDVDKWLKDYAKKKTKEAKKKTNEDVVIKIGNKSKINRDEYCEKNLGYLYIKKLFTDLGLKKICAKIAKKENLEFNLYENFVTILCNKYLYHEDRTISTYEFSKMVLNDYEVSPEEISETLKIISKYSYLIQTEFYKNIREEVSCDDSLLFYDCSNNSIVNGNIAKYLKSNRGDNTLLLSKTFFDSNGFPCFMYLEGSSRNNIKDKEKYRKFLQKYFTSPSVHILPESIKVNSKDEIFKNFDKVYTMIFQEIDSFNDKLKEWVYDNKGWRAIEDVKKYNIEEVIDALDNRTYDYDKYQNFIHTIFYKSKQIDISIPNSSDVLSQCFYLGYHYQYMLEIENSRSYVINTAQKVIESKVNDTVLSENYKNEKVYQTLKNNRYVQGDEQLFFDDSVFRSDERFDGYYCICENYVPEDPELIIKPTLFKLNHYDYLCARQKNEVKVEDMASYDEYLMANYVTNLLLCSVINYISCKTDYKFTNEYLREYLKSINFRKVPKQGWTSAFCPNKMLDDLKDITNIDLDYEFLALKEMQKIVKLA